jgi:hypothetical protein
MRIKTFQGAGCEGIAKATKDANEWLAKNPSIVILNSTAAMTSIGSPEEMYQSYVITIFYAGAT